MGIANEPRRASTDLAVAFHSAERIGATGCGAGTRVDALVLDASLVERAVRVGSATDSAEVAFADLPLEALTISMALDVTPALDAPFVQSAVLVATTADSAVSQVADVSRRAFLVLAAAHGFPHAGNVSVRASDKTGGATAHHPMVDDFALRIWAARRASFARILAPVADAGKMVQTLFVGATSDLAPVPDAHFSVVAFAVGAAQCVTVVGEASLSVCAVSIRGTFDSAPGLDAGIV